AGMDCPTEEALLRKSLGKVEGVLALHFDLMGRVLSVDHQLPALDALSAAIVSAGMTSELLGDDGAAPAAALDAPAVPAALRWRMGLAGLAAVGAEAWAYSVGNDQAAGVIALSLTAVLLGGLPTLRKGWIALRSLTLNIHLLMSLAVTGALALGQWPEAAMVVWLFGLAEMLEALSLERARKAIRALTELAPETAWVRQDDGSWVEAPSQTVVVGAIVRVRAGERVALDGVVLEGASSVNQAAITGESMPVAKAPGDSVLAGSVNELGVLELRVSAPASDSMLARMARSVQEAQSQRAPTQRFVDRFARVYTPIVVGLAVLLALVPPLLLSQAFGPWIYKALVMMVIACPCALVISTPVTVVSALTAAARRGVLIKGGVHLEQARLIRCIALDKTGTLTEGRPSLVGLESFDAANSEATLLRHAASLNAASSHPIASALLKAQSDASEASAGLLPVQDFLTLPGRGVQAQIGQQVWRIGNKDLALQHSDEPRTRPELHTTASGWESLGHTVLWLLCETRVMGLLAVSDTVREHSQDVVSTLQTMGVQVLMLSGDHRASALAIGRQVGLSEAHIEAPLLPDAKLQAISRWRERLQPGERIAMVGDGINDAPALARADVGIAMGASGTAVAIETADVALLQDDLRRLPELIQISRRAARVLWQNISIALGLKVAVLALTLMAMGSLWLAVFADAGAALLVVLNGLRLLRSPAVAAS
ncbi:MAG: cation-translocating P-type ATPase, partial [Paucibacter sp.]|nr:cation-translocating P-type ATPase [Roseateles sp.]